MPSRRAEPIPVIVFARAPVAGACKTRLIPVYGRIGATRIYRDLVTRAVCVALAGASGPVQVWTTPSPGHPFFANLRRRFAVNLMRQCDGDLGRRMGFAIRTAIRDGAPAAILVGTDAADLEAQDLRDAAACLQGDFDAVLQPAQDGGFVLIGLRVDAQRALRGIAWSSGRELGQTLGRLQGIGLRVALLRTRADIDLPSDLRRARQNGTLAPRICGVSGARTQRGAAWDPGSTSRSRETLLKGAPSSQDR